MIVTRKPSGQFRSVFPVLSVYWIRSCVFFSPHRDLNPSRSRSRMYCSLTGVPAVTFPPHSTSAIFVASFTSYSVMYSPCRIRWTPIFNAARIFSPGAGMSVRGCGGSYPARTISRARALASARTRSRFIVMLSEFLRKPRPRASWADVATLAVAMVSKIFFIASISSTDSPRPPGRIDSALSTARSSISLQPPAPGSKPTPTSTNPM